MAVPCASSKISSSFLIGTPGGGPVSSIRAVSDSTRSDVTSVNRTTRTNTAVSSHRSTGRSSRSGDAIASASLRAPLTLGRRGQRMGATPPKEVRMARMMADCRRWPSESDCSLTIIGEEEEVVRAAAEHAASVHGHEDTPEMREQMRDSLDPAGAYPNEPRQHEPLPG